MSSLSITAPQFTDEEERLEQETISEEERQAAHLDLFGSSNGSSNNNSGSSNVNSGTGIPFLPSLCEDEIDEEFRQALDEIPIEDKEGYLEAIERAPMLVEEESNPRWFLRAEKNQPWAAAERFVNYWELRRWLFGERAWLPLTATGDGALSPFDVELLETGFCTLLPREDRHGRGILCFQVPQQKLDADRLAMARVTFYVLSLALWTRPLVLQNGLVMVANTMQYTMARYDRKFIKCVAYLFTGWHPVVTKAFHITAPPGNKSCFQLVLPFIKYFMTRQIRQRFRLHRGTTKQCAMNLEEYGIPIHNLPVEMGGYFTQEQFVEWLHEFIRPKELIKEEQYVASLMNYDSLEQEELPPGFFFAPHGGDIINSHGSLILPMMVDTNDRETNPSLPTDVIFGVANTI